MAKKAPPTAITNPNGWDASHGTYIAGRAYLDGVDRVAAVMDDRWGCGRLRLLVSPELRERFDRQRYKLNAAILHGDLEAVRRESNRMLTAWDTLDREAKKTAADPLAPEVWEVTLEDGTVAAIVKDNTAAFKVWKGNRAVAVYTLEEIAKLLTFHRGVLEAKLQWPGAEVEAVRKSVRDPLNGITHAGSFDDKLDDLWHGGG